MGILAQEFMTKDVVTVKTTTTLQKLVEVLIAKSIGGVPVVDEKDELVGVISKTDLITHGLEKELSAYLNDPANSGSFEELPDFDNLLGPEPNKMTVDKIMKRPVVSASPKSSISELVNIMLENKIHRIIIAEKNKVVGIVTTMDILRMIDTD